MRLLGELPYDIPKTDGSMPEELADIEMAYHIPFENGVLQVSALANAKSGIVPLTTIVDGPSPALELELPRRFPLKASNALPKTRVTIIDGSEAPDDEAQKPSDVAGTIGVDGRLSQGLIEAIVGIQGRDEMIDAQIRMLIKQFGQDLPYPIDEDDLPTDEGATIRQQLEIHLPQGYAHAIVASVSQITQEYRLKDIMEGLDNYIVNAQRNYIALCLAAGGLLAASGFVLGSPAGGVVSASIETAISQWQAHRSWSKYLGSYPSRRASAEQSSAAFGLSVAEVVHQAYCRTHFEQSMLGEQPQPGES